MAKPLQTNYDLLRYCASVSALSYLGFFALDRLNAGFVSAFFPMSWLLWIAVVLSAAAVLRAPKTAAPWAGSWSVGLGIALAAGGAIAWWVRHQVWGSLQLAGVSGILVALLVLALALSSHEDRRE